MAVLGSRQLLEQSRGIRVCQGPGHFPIKQPGPVLQQPGKGGQLAPGVGLREPGNARLGATAGHQTLPGVHAACHAVHIAETGMFQDRCGRAAPHACLAVYDGGLAGLKFLQPVGKVSDRDEPGPGEMSLLVLPGLPDIHQVILTAARAVEELPHLLRRPARNRLEIVHDAHCGPPPRLVDPLPVNSARRGTPCASVGRLRQPDASPFHHPANLHRNSTSKGYGICRTLQADEGIIFTKPWEIRACKTM